MPCCTSSSSTVEKLDGLLWVNINLLDRFSEEFKIQLAWLRQSPPDAVDLGVSFGTFIRQLQDLLVAGEHDGSLRPGDGTVGTRARSMYEVLLTPENVVRHAGPSGALALALRHGAARCPDAPLSAAAQFSPGTAIARHSRAWLSREDRVRPIRRSR